MNGRGVHGRPSRKSSPLVGGTGEDLRGDFDPGQEGGEAGWPDVERCRCAIEGTSGANA